MKNGVCVQTCDQIHFVLQSSSSCKRRWKEEKDVFFLRIHEKEDLFKVGGFSSLIDKTQRRVRKDYEIYEIWR